MKTDKLREGMVIKQDVYLSDGRMLLTKGTILSSQMIQQLNNYRIKDVTILSANIQNSEEARNAVEKGREFDKAYIKRVTQMPEYKAFKDRYVKTLDLLEKNFNYIVVKNQKINEEDLIKRTTELMGENPTTYTLFGMMFALKTTDDSTYVHSINVAIISRLMGLWLEKDEEQLDILTLAGLLHDVGKCSVPQEILKKTTSLSEEEYNTMKLHTTYGYGLLKRQGFPEIVSRAALKHHERYDGSGYPFGVDGDSLGQVEAIVAIADVYDAMTSPRCYRPALCPFDVIATYERDGLNKYHPKYISLFLKKIADSFLNSEVVMSDGDVARIIYINHSNLTRPIVQYKDERIVNLMERPELFVQSVI